MNNKFFFRYVALAMVSLILISCSNNLKKKGKVVASVNNHKVYLSDFGKRLKGYLLTNGIKDNIQLRESVLYNLINEIVVYYYDNNKKIFNNPQYQKKLIWGKRGILLSYLKDREIFAKIKVTDKEIRQAFVRVNQKLAAKHLYAKTKKEADNLYQLLKMGANWDSLAKQTFTDSTLRKNGGYLGYFTWGDMDPAFEDTAYNMKIGGISRPVKTAEGYSIIKLVDRKSDPLLTEHDFLIKRANIIRTLKMMKKRPAEEKYINKIFDKNKLKFYDGNLRILLNVVTSINSKKVEQKFNLDKVCAVYDGKKFTDQQIFRKIEMIPSFSWKKITSIGDLKAAIEGFLIQDKLYQIALEKGYNKVEAVKKAYQDYVMNTFLQYKMNEIAYNTAIPDSVLKAYYKTNIDQFSEPRKMNVQEIIVKNKKLAYKIISLIHKGENFGLLAEKYSLRKWSAQNKGIIGLSPFPKFGNLKNIFWKAKINKIIGPLKIENYFGIFKVLKKIKREPIDFENIKSLVLKRAQQDRKTKSVIEYLVNKRKHLPIKINLKLLASYKVKY